MGYLIGVEYDIDWLFVEVKDMSLYCIVMDISRLGRVFLLLFFELFVSLKNLYLFKCCSVYIFYKLVF